MTSARLISETGSGYSLPTPVKYDTGGRGEGDNYHGLGWQARYVGDVTGPAGQYPKGFRPSELVSYPTPGGEEDPAPIATDGVTANSGLVSKRAPQKKWSTPTVTQPMMPTETLRRRMKDGLHDGETSVPLVEVLQREALRKHDAMLPTPTSQNGLRGGSQSEHHPGKWQSPGHPEYGELNPEWVEWLMGWCRGWTSLDPIDPEEVRRWLDDNGETARGGDQWGEDPSDDAASGMGKTVPKPGSKELESLRQSRIAALGNGQVSAVAAAAFLHLWSLPWPADRTSEDEQPEGTT